MEVATPVALKAETVGEVCGFKALDSSQGGCLPIKDRWKT